MRVNEIAAAIHRHMCECPKHGYTQGAGRWGAGPHDDCTIWLDGRPYTIPGNDFDCSSSVKKAWELALQHTPYAGCLGRDGYDRDGRWVSWYTGNERAGFTATGLFEWKPVSFAAEPGDLYLNEQHHVAMAQGEYIISEFLSSENGGIYGQAGDQTGGESVVRDFWWPWWGWDGILHYNGKADEDMTPEQAEQLRFVYDHLHWREDTHYSDIGNLIAEFPIEYETIDEHGERHPLTQPLGKRLGYMDQRTHVIEAKLKQIEETQEAILDTLDEIRESLELTR